MFSKHGNNKPRGSMSSSKTFKTVTSSTSIENKFISGSGIGASSVATRRAKNRRSIQNNQPATVLSTTGLMDVRWLLPKGEGDRGL